MKVNQLKAGALLSYLQMLINIVIGLLYTPAMLRLLGKSEYGLYNTVSSTISMLSILSLGFDSSYLRFFTKYKLMDDKESIDKLNGLFLIVLLFIGVVAFLCGIFLSFHLNLVFGEGLTVQEYDICRSLMILLTINLAISFPMSIFQNIISAYERYVFLKLLGMIKTVLGPLVTLPLLLMGFRSIAVVAVTLGISVITDIVYFIYVKQVLQMGFQFNNFEQGLFKDLLVFTSVIALNLIVDQVNNNVDKFLLGRFRGTEAVAVYSVGFFLYQCYMIFSTAISGVFSPRIYRIVNATRNSVEEQKRQLSDLFIKVGRLQFLILALIVSGFSFWGKIFISFWAGEGYEESYYVVLLLMIPSLIPLIQNLGIGIQRAQNKHQFRGVVYTFMAILNVLLTLSLCPQYGAIGATVGTAISLVVANGVMMNIYYYKKCNIDIGAFWKSIGKLCVGLFIPVSCGLILSNFFIFDSVVSLFLGIGVYALIYGVSMWSFGINDYEKSLILSFVKK